MRHPGGAGLRPVRRRPAYLGLLGGILVSYAAIIGFGDSLVGNLARVVLLGILAVTAARLRAGRAMILWFLGFALFLLALVGWASVWASAQVAFGLVGAASMLLTTAVIVAVATALRAAWRVDTATVLGVLCIYLLLALLFASVHQLLAASDGEYLDGSLHGARGGPDAADLLYFSVITMATVGFGDITPASEAARAVTVVEALVGQLYLVSVVAIVVGGWRRGEEAASPR